MDELSFGIVLAQIINFWILFFIFKHFLWEKIVDAIEEHRKKISDSNDAELKAKVKLEEAKKEAESILKASREKASMIEKNADELSKKRSSDIISKAEEEAKYIKERTLEDLEREKLFMVNSMKSKIIDLSLRLTWKIFSKESANKDFLEKELEILTK